MEKDVDEVGKFARFIKAKIEERNLTKRLASFSMDMKKPVAASIDDITLHLANEKGLSIHSSPNLDDLSIHLPSHPNIL